MPTGKTSDRIAALERKKAQIAERLKTLSAQTAERKRKEDARRKIIVGAAVLAHAEHDPMFASRLREALDAAVTRPLDRKTLADLLP